MKFRIVRQTENYTNENYGLVITNGAVLYRIEYRPWWWPRYKKLGQICQMPYPLLYESRWFAPYVFSSRIAAMRYIIGNYKSSKVVGGSREMMVKIRELEK